jgi:hypothetical protein
MSIHDGVVTVADDDIRVVVELDDGRIRLSGGGREIGEWRTDQCHIRHLSDSTYAIEAENEILRFVPNQPGIFAAAVNGGMPETSEVTRPPEPEPEHSSGDGVREAPPAKPVTMALFYALCAATAGLAVWSLISIIL